MGSNGVKHKMLPFMAGERQNFMGYSKLNVKKASAAFNFLCTQSLLLTDMSVQLMCDLWEPPQLAPMWPITLFGKVTSININ